MKKLTVLWTIIMVLIMSCNKEELPTPVASFHISKLTFEAGEAIEVENLSLNATGFTWECGPKTYITKGTEKFMFVLLEPGTYTLRLTATNGLTESTKEQQIIIIPKPETVLQIKTIFENGNVFPSCIIHLYNTEADFLNSENAVHISKTNDLGIFEIKNIKAGTYWFDAYYMVDNDYTYLNWYQGGIYSTNVENDKTNSVNVVLKLFKN